MRLAGKTAIVTGGSSGIGRAIARLFAREGARVLIGDVSETVLEGGEPTCAMIAADGGSALFQHCDVSAWADVDALVNRAVAEWGALDIMVNNAAIRGAGVPLLETTEDDWDRVMAINAKGVFFGCKRAVQQFLTQPVQGDARGRIVNISSQHGMVAAPGKLAYGTGKAAAAYITKQVAVDYAKDHILCNAVAPGRILTGRPNPEALEYSHSRTPMPRLGRPDDVASAALFLASDASFVTGHNLMVDGGWMAF
ncbi:SDR family NAD(P)-dependent oxidoreductase [Plastoroseomonas arctica]|uniref:SDR family oxidoreductase n=1 Tax=Plastoroseomonas arctica TaxID=1509237 RepID=A0AAF1JYK4_9PROT|nr:SDR family oxidoreductase [Plastoroseomonas arctica]MBR0657019.1 SDR family oxidoreductase [Plastoroseomonas arctica]